MYGALIMKENQLQSIKALSNIHLHSGVIKCGCVKFKVYVV